MNSELMEKIDTNELEKAFGLAKKVVSKEYLCDLNKYEVKKLPQDLGNECIEDRARIFKFTQLISDKNENVMDKMVTVLNAAHSSKATVVTIICGKEDTTDYYWGIVDKEKEADASTKETVLKGVLNGNFSGLKTNDLNEDERKNLIEEIFKDDCCVDSISGIASIRKEEENSSYAKFVQGIEHLVDSLQGKTYNLVVIADPVSDREIAEAKLGLETLHTQFSPFLRTSFSVNENESITLTESHTDSVTRSIGTSTSLANNYSTTNGWSESTTEGNNENKDVGQILGVLGAAGIGMLGGNIIAASMIGGQFGSVAIGSSGTNYGKTDTSSQSYSKSTGTTETTSDSSAIQNGNTTSEAEGKMHGKMLQFSNENKTVKNVLDQIDKNIDRLKKCEAYGAFNCAAYVIASDPQTAGLVADSYNALMRGDASCLQTSHINRWSKDDTKEIKKYLEKFSHPLFQSPENDEILFSPATMLNAYELAVSMGLPKKSINGLPVFEMASFGRNVFTTDTEENQETSAEIKLGKIYHMGEEQNVSVNLNKKSLAMHTFITGSTGSGKSNTIYQLLKELKNNDTHFLVVEPAKGEYKHVFGNENNVHVYGTNSDKSPLLKINPFRFPEGIHVLEHIDRVIEIFNVCWPMYAAMPAVLKDSVERAYVNAGWNLATSKNKYSNNLYPTFADVLDELVFVMNESAFSGEVRDNYVGSLATRIKSLTNGIYGEIFSSDELGDNKLFEENVIVDLSRVGSVETKSMIMGILVMRLQEYRIASDKMNASLQHVTVLEEAHNLLKKTSTEQCSESSNLLGKSVEMLSNAIAEMRTYGEGFIIADQAPGLLDKSVIRNTNTKIIMRLPDEEDRNLVGKAANLSEDQIKELSKLPTGVAAVYQNNWAEPVLCKIEKYDESNQPYQYNSSSANSDGETETSESKNNILKALLDKAAGEELDMNISELSEIILGSDLKASVKREILSLISGRISKSLESVSKAVTDIVCDDEMVKGISEVTSVEDWESKILDLGSSYLDRMSIEYQNKVMECIVLEYAKKTDDPEKYVNIWEKYKKGDIC